MLTIRGMKTDEAIREAGSVKALAQSLGITVHAIYQWGEDVPRLRELEILLQRQQASEIQTVDGAHG